MSGEAAGCVMKLDKLEVVVEPPKHGSAKLEMLGLPVALGCRLSGALKPRRLRNC